MKKSAIALTLGLALAFGACGNNSNNDNNNDGIKPSTTKPADDKTDTDSNTDNDNKTDESKTDQENSPCSKDEVGARKCQGHNILICKPSYTWELHSEGCGQRNCVDSIGENGLSQATCQASDDDIGTNLEIGVPCTPAYFVGRCANDVAVNCAMFDDELGIVVGSKCDSSCQTYTKDGKTYANCSDICNKSEALTGEYTYSSSFYVDDEDGCSRITHTTSCDATNKSIKSDTYTAYIPERSSECANMKTECGQSNPTAICESILDDCTTPDNSNDDDQQYCDFYFYACDKYKGGLLLDVFCSASAYNHFCADTDSTDCKELIMTCTEQIAKMTFCQNNDDYNLPY